MKRHTSSMRKQARAESPDLYNTYSVKIMLSIEHMEGMNRTSEHQQPEIS